MFAQQRHLQIMDLLRTGGSVRVSELASRFDVTEETIRRDLETLGNAGKLVRTHGGAIATSDQELPLSIRQATNLKEKIAIAEAAIGRMQERQVIGLDASSTAYEVARRVPDRPMTVVTNGMPIATVLADRAHVRVVLTGGTLDAGSMSLTGAGAEATLERFNLSQLFLSCKGVEVDRGLSEATEEHAAIKHRMMRAAERVILLADHSKINVRSSVCFASIQEVDELITDRRADG
ncbi:MAG: DeoR/GlpR family DNA-binding transcription regulator, partial [Phycisphaeraceae bacterium]|nr:DeoR/GlpR family DNA-binding transcription regulator [Phycisphaeraceae bacterium]